MSSPQLVSMDDVQKLVDDQIAKTRAEYEALIAAQKEDADARVSALEEAVKAAQRAGQPSTSVPEHAGGPGTEIADTWSQYEQERARAAREAA